LSTLLTKYQAVTAQENKKTRLAKGKAAHVLLNSQMVIKMKRLITLNLKIMQFNNMLVTKQHKRNMQENLSSSLGGRGLGKVMIHMSDY
jgi:hypothetical protein